jgi:hydrogenase expression/formation protein HypC
VSSCSDDHCITCSDEGKEMHVVVARQDGLAMCADAEGGQAEVMTELVGSVEPGDAVLVHAGVAIARLA